MQTGYCGNVHPGRTLDEVKQNLTKHSLAVKAAFSPDRPMNIGLWLSATTLADLADQDSLLKFRDWLTQHGLVPYTLNGFPFGDFHQSVVKHEVYKPTWAQKERLEYTVRLAEILDVLLPAGMDGTISTLPLGWPVDGNKANPGNESSSQDDSFIKACSDNLRTCADRLDQISQKSDRNIFLCIEPEPGCILDTAEDLANFFERSLLTDSESQNTRIKEHVGVCHDVCHSAVMFEEQATAVSVFKDAGIRIGKVQVSSAVAVDFDSGLSTTEKLKQLQSFSEPTYLHQTSVRMGDEIRFFEDLHLALEEFGSSPIGQWRVHFHVPIFSDALQEIGTTQTDIKRLVDAIKASGEPMPHFEVETYAWNVLPDELRSGTLADGISKELVWFENLMNSTNS
jgi:hypothetical protein